MNNNRIDGAGHKAAGAIKEAVGKITGDKTLQGKGRRRKDGRQGAEWRRQSSRRAEIKAR